MSPVLQSISFSDWLNCVVTGDALGEVILAVLPHIGLTAQYIRRTLDRRLVSLSSSSSSWSSDQISEAESVLQ